MKQPCHTLSALLGVLFLVFCAGSVRANVYATDIQVNGSSRAAVTLPGGNLAVTYILNDKATGGVWVEFYSGTNLVQTLASTNGDAGTNAGTNMAVWEDVTNLSAGAYTVSITAASAGYETWTNISHDGSNYQVLSPRGICVDRNTNSIFYGRVFVASAANSTQAEHGASSGIFKRNADGCPAADGIFTNGFTNGGWNWGDSGFSPWKMAVGPDDRLYVDDFTDQGIVLSFDPVVAAHSLRHVIGTNNYPAGYPNALLSSLAVGGTASQVQIWMSDSDLQWFYNPFGSSGITGWQLTDDGMAATNDTGTSIVPVDPDYLSQAPYDLSVDTNGVIYTSQFIMPGDGPAYALLSFPPYEGTPETTADWAVGMYPALVDVYGVGVDPGGNYVAVAVLGRAGDPEYDTTGGLYLYDAIDGDFVCDLDQKGGDPYYSVAWDAVGNLYACDGNPSNSVWRVYSPPGTNQATTVAIPIIQAYDALVPPCLKNPVTQSNQLTFTLAGQSNVTYVIQHSCDLTTTNWCAAATNFSTNASRVMCVPMCGDKNFYRAVSVP